MYPKEFLSEPAIKVSGSGYEVATRPRSQPKGNGVPEHIRRRDMPRPPSSRVSRKPKNGEKGDK